MIAPLMNEKSRADMCVQKRNDSWLTFLPTYRFQIIDKVQRDVLWVVKLKTA